MKPEERFLPELLPPDKDGRSGYGLRDIVTGLLCETSGGEIDRFPTVESAQGHRLMYHYATAWADRG